MNSNEDPVEGIFKELELGKIDRGDLEFLLKNPHFRRKPRPLKQFIVDAEYLNCPHAWPEVLEITSGLMTAKNQGDRFSDYLEAVFDAGIGSGKSFFVSFVFTYVVYWLSCLKDPQEFYGLAPKSVICLVNCSTTATQAKRVVFGKIQARVDTSPYFQKCFKPDDSIRSEIRFPNDIVIFPGSSSETAPIGYDVLVANVDEASFFISTDSRDNASEVFDTLDRRIRSRFEERGLMLTTSSPRYVDDFTEKKFKESESDKTIYGIKRAVWETKPRDVLQIQKGEYFELDHPVTRKKTKIPLVYQRAFIKNPKKAWRDYGALASLALQPFFTDEELAKIRGIMQSSGIPLTIKDGVIDYSVIKPEQGSTYMAHVDLGLKRDACGVAIGHIKNGNVIIDFIFRIVCRQRAMELDEINQYYDLVIGMEQVDIGGLLPNPHGVLGIIYQLSALGFFFGKVTFDGFQSAHSMQQLNENGFHTELLSVDKTTAAYDTLKSLINLNNFRCPDHPYIMNEGERLELIEGKKVDHPKNASKDLMDAIAAVSISLANDQSEEVEEEETMTDDSMRVQIQQEF